MTHRFLARDGLPLNPCQEITKRTQGRPSRYARAGRMTQRFLARDRATPQPVPRITKRTQGRPSRCALGGRMTHRFFARDGLPLNPYQELRNEPKVSNPGVPQATEAELIGLQNLRNCF
jgi:hypothetical protein